MKSFFRTHATLTALVVLTAALSFLSEAFFTPRNLSNITLQVTIIGIIAVGMTLVILLGGIDLSVGSIVGLASIVVTLFMQSGWNVWLAILATILTVGVGIGVWNGVWIAHYRIPAFIITLGMMTIARGAALVLSDGSSIPVTDPVFPLLGGEYIAPASSAVILGLALALFLFATLRAASRQRSCGVSVGARDIALRASFGVAILALAAYVFIGYRGIPYPVAFLIALILAGAFMLSNTRLGRRIYATGGNREAARLSGINVFRVELTVYVIVTTLAAVSGILLTSRLNGANPNLGNMFELDAIASVIIGGTSPMGGVGTIGGTVVGSVLIGVMNNGMSLLGVSSFYQLIIKGFIIIVAVWFDVMNKRRKA